MELDNSDKTYALLRVFIHSRLEKPQLEELFSLLEKLDGEQLSRAVREILNEETPAADLDFIQERVDRLQEDILAKIDPARQPLSPRKPLRLWLLAGIAASLIVAFTISYFWQRYDKQNIDRDQGIASTIMPGTNKATITVNGQDFELDGDQSQLRLGADSLFYSDGQLLTTTTGEQTIEIKTPLGGQYQLTLADGSAVWLNAGSQLRYNTGFGKSNRDLHLVGEAYFDVAKNPDLPFMVNTQDQQIEVLGTAFNVSAYADEPMVKTTLQRGALTVTSEAQRLTLKPNQQSVWDKAAQKMAIRDVHASSIVAWKDGIFDFHGMSLEECMRIIARWYQLDVVYQEKVPTVLLGGKMSRGVRLSTFLDFLELNFNVHGEVTPDRQLVITTHKK